jgi:hypothetical protein
VPPPEKQTTPSLAPRAGLLLMVIIVVAIGLIALYANVQKARRDQIEKVAIILITPTPAPSPSPQE